MLPNADLSRPSQTKADPFSTKLHRRIDAVLLLVAIIIIALVVRASAHGQTALSRLSPSDHSISN